jgi:hypothetical protein
MVKPRSANLGQVPTHDPDYKTGRVVRHGSSPRVGAEGCENIVRDLHGGHAPIVSQGARLCDLSASRARNMSEPPEELASRFNLLSVEKPHDRPSSRAPQILASWLFQAEAPTAPS